jgi:hypothetical protein
MSNAAGDASHSGFAVILTAAAWRGHAKAGLMGPAWHNRNERRIDAG